MRDFEVRASWPSKSLAVLASAQSSGRDAVCGACLDAHCGWGPREVEGAPAQRGDLGGPCKHRRVPPEGFRLRNTASRLFFDLNGKAISPIECTLAASDLLSRFTPIVVASNARSLLEEFARRHDAVASRATRAGVRKDARASFLRKLQKAGQRLRHPSGNALFQYQVPGC